MKVELIAEEVFGEPGPNIVWICSRHEYQLFLALIDKMLVSDSIINLESEFNVSFTGLKRVVLKSSASGKLLTHLTANGELCTELSAELWECVKQLLDPLKINKGFQYIEFDDEEIVEDVNWIMKVC